jgi:hypothetical protein
MVESRIRRISPALAKREEEVKTAQIGAGRRISSPWYGFRADLAIAGQDGVATPLTLWLNRLGNWAGRHSAGFTMPAKFNPEAMIRMVALPDRRLGCAGEYATDAAKVIGASPTARTRGGTWGRHLDFNGLEFKLSDSKKEPTIRDEMRAGVASHGDHHRK